MIKVVENRAEWDEFVCASGGHPLQLWGWGEVKSNHGPWTAHRLMIDDVGGAQVLIRQLPRPFGKMAYIPRGPVVTDVKNRAKILTELATWAKEQGSIELKIEPDWTDKIGLDGWQLSKNRILLAHTMCIDLSVEPETLLSAMDAKTRQNVRRSLKYGVTARRADASDLPQIMQIYHQTAQRANFSLHPDNYYTDMLADFGDDCHIYVAERENQIISFVWCIVTPHAAFELYGGMNDDGRKYRSNFALKWLAMRAEAEQGTAFYDMNGLLDGGVSDFKRGFAPDDTTWVGTYDKPLSPKYNLYEKALPAGKKIIQKLHNR